jgi:hypothetical protein
LLKKSDQTGVSYFRVHENEPAVTLTLDGMMMHGAEWLGDAILREIEKNYSWYIFGSCN